MLGTVEPTAGESACGLPVSVQIANAQREISARFGNGIEIRNVDLYSLEGAERDVALDAVVAGEPSPFVLVNARLVCSGAVDGAAVLAAVAFFATPSADF